MLTMMLFVRKVSVPLALLLVLSFVAGATFAPAAVAGQVQVEQCCDKDAIPEVPVDDGECFDCNCPTCQFVINSQPDYIELLTPTITTFSWLISEMLPSGFIRTIDYPPEIV